MGRTMGAATRAIAIAPGAASVRNAWTEFWKDPAQTRCASGDPFVWRALTAHWSALAASLSRGAHVLDLGCGAGAVGNLLLAARPDLHVTGVDSARIPLSLRSQHELLPDTAMENLPFEAGRFAAVVSQFGFEYSRTADTVREIARVMTPGARISFVVHHEASPVVATTRARLSAIEGLLAPAMRAAFCGGDAPGFHGEMAALTDRFPHDTLISELAGSLTVRVGRAGNTRVAIWRAIEDALEPERCISSSLSESCVAPEQLDEWLSPLRRVFPTTAAAALRDAGGEPFAWRLSI